MIKIRKAELSDITALGNMRLKFRSHMENSNPDIWRVTDEGKEQVESQVAAFWILLMLLHSSSKMIKV